MEHHHQNKHPDTHEINDPAKPGRYDTLVRQLTEKLESTKTGMDLLKETYASGNKGQFELMVDDLVYEALEKDEVFNRNVDEIQDLRKSGIDSKREEEIRQEQNALFNVYKQDIISIAGLPNEAGLDEYVIAENTIKHKIESFLENGGNTDDVLKHLGILTQDKNGKDIFTYPHGLFPAETDKKWDLYLDRVTNHLRTKRGVDYGTVDQDDLSNAAAQRQLAHNSVTTDVHRLLGFNNTAEDEKKSFLETRNMLAKMRDSRFPTVETAEGHRTATRIIMASNALKTLNTKLSDLKK